MNRSPTHTKTKQAPPTEITRERFRAFILFMGSNINIIGRTEKGRKKLVFLKGGRESIVWFLQLVAGDRR